MPRPDLVCEYCGAKIMNKETKLAVKKGPPYYCSTECESLSTYYETSVTDPIIEEGLTDFHSRR